MEEEKDFSKSYEQKQEDLKLEIGRAFKDYDEEKTEKLLLEYEKNVEEQNKGLYSQHRKETKGEKIEEEIELKELVDERAGEEEKEEQNDSKDQSLVQEKDYVMELHKMLMKESKSNNKDYPESERLFNSILEELEKANSEDEYKKSLGELSKIDALLFYNNNDAKFAKTAIEEIRTVKRDLLKKSKIFENIKYEEDPQKIKSLLDEIGKNLTKQPQSIQNMYEEIKEDFILFTEINDYRYLWTAVEESDGIIIGWVEDKNKPGEWKARFFRCSGSDKQWKSVPGLRENGTHTKKGEEDNPQHHYVQSAKLHKEIYEILNYIPLANVGGTFGVKEYLPIAKRRYSNEDEFKENHITFKKESWRELQNRTNYFDRHYNILNNKDWFIQANIYKFLENKVNYEPFKKIKLYIDSSFGGNKDPEVWLKNENFLKIYRENISEAFKEAFSKINYPEDMIPDFSKKPEYNYIKNGILLGKTLGDDINIEEYRVKNNEGDEIIFAMAHDSQGRVYIDNIYDPRVGFNSYGTLDKIVRMGYLVYKPEDYKEQVLGFTDKYKGKENGEYVEINKLWENDPIIKKYKESLINRGILKKIDK